MERPLAERQVALDETFIDLAQTKMAEMAQMLGVEAIGGLALWNSECEGLGTFEVGADLLRCLEPLGLEYRAHPPMILNARTPLGSLHAGITLPIQAHLSLEKAARRNRGLYGLYWLSI